MKHEKLAKYPKFVILFITFSLAYLLLTDDKLFFARQELLKLGYFGTFIAGMFYAYGFTAGPATAVFLLNSKAQDFLLSGLAGGFGALVSDLLIFKFIRITFTDEIELLANEKIFVKMRSNLSPFLKKYLLPFLAAFVIASPLPDEIGVTMMATSRNISTKQFILLSFLLNALGIFAILHIGRFL